MVRFGVGLGLLTAGGFGEAAGFDGTASGAADVELGDGVGLGGSDVICDATT